MPPPTPLGETNDRETLSTCRTIIFSGYSSCYTQVSTISDLTLESSSSSASTFDNYTIVYHRACKK